MKTAPVDITATKAVMPLRLRTTSINWLARGIAALIVTAGILYPVSAHATNYSVGVVTKGTFLLSEKANVKREGKSVHGLVGYLPIGTRVYHVDEPVILNNLAEGQPEIYIPVFSSIGINGLLKEDRFQRVKDKRIAVVVSSSEIALHNPDPDKGKFRRLLKIGRYGGNYIEIVGSRDDEFFDAVLYRTVRIDNYPMSEPVRLWKELVKQGKVVIVEPQNFTEQTLPAPRWSPGHKLDKSFVEEMVEKVREKFGDEIGYARKFLEDANRIQCLIKASAELEAGIKFLGNGLSFKLDLAIKNQNHMLLVQQHELVIGGRTRNYVILKSIKCDGGLDPERLHRLTLQEGPYNPAKRDVVLLRDWEEKPSPYIISLGGREAPFRMIRIKGESEYLTALRRLNGFVAGTGGYIGKLPPEEQEILLNFILREISYFEHRENVVPPSVSQISRGKGTALPVTQPLLLDPIPTSISSRPEKLESGG